MAISFSPYHLSNSVETIIHTLPLRRYTAYHLEDPFFITIAFLLYSSPHTAVSPSIATVCDCHSGVGIQYRYQSLELSLPPPSLYCLMARLVDTSSSGLSPSPIVSILSVSFFLSKVHLFCANLFIYLPRKRFLSLLLTKFRCANHPFIYVLYSHFRYYQINLNRIE